MNIYLPLILFCFSTSITPGPNNLMIMMAGAKFGMLRSLPHLMGITIGFLLMVLLIGLGMGKLFSYFPWLYTIMKYTGTAYMLYMAWCMIRTTNGLHTKDSEHQPFTFIKAVLFQWVNPKAWIMAMSVMATYGAANNTLQHKFFIATLYGLINLPCVGVWLICGVAISQYLRNPQYFRYFNIVMSILLILSILPILF